MKNLTPELIAKAKAAASAEELFQLGKANGVELTEADARTYFAQLNANGTVSDDELDLVAGGGSCPGDSEEEDTAPAGSYKKCYKCNTKNILSAKRCKKCLTCL